MKRSFCAIAICAWFLLFTGVQSIQAQDTVLDSHDPKLPCTFQYPLSWKLLTGDGISGQYAQFDLIGPGNAHQTLQAHISITVLDAGAAKTSSPGTFLDMMADSAKKLYNKYTLLKHGKTQVWGQNVPTLETSYALPLPLESAEPVWTIIREEKVASAHEGKIWVFDYIADLDDYEKYIDVFHHVVETFFFK